MRKGSRTVPWTTSDEAYLLENAGKVPVREICRHLRKSSQAVYSKARHMREEGFPIVLRCFVPRTGICPACGCSRSTMGDFGICRLCRKRDQLAGIEARIAELLPMLSQADRDRYEETEAERGSRADQMPKPPSVPSDATYYERMRAMEAWEIEVEHARIRNLEREIKAAQKRKERIEKKVKSMPKGISKQIGEGKCNESSR